MRKLLFPIEKLAMVFFYLQLLVGLDKLTYLTCALLLMGLSVAIEGARPYTPLLFLIIFLEMLDLSILQVIIIIIAGVATVALKLYDINVPIKGPYLMGHRYKLLKFDDQLMVASLFYPTLTKTKKIQWIPKRQYNKVLYQIFHVDPKARRIPYPLFNFVVSYLHKIYMPAQQMSPFLQQSTSQSSKNSDKIIIFSHGLGSHKNAYSSIFASWASQGYTILSIDHDRDQVCVDFRKVSEDDPVLIKEYLFKYRNRDLNIRVEEMQKVVEMVMEDNFMQNNLGRPGKFKQIILAGHSFGGGTAVATKAFLNQKYKDDSEKLSKIQKIICLDPWMFPFGEQVYANFQNENILIINSEYFFKQVPYIYELESLYAKLLKNNHTMKAYLVRGMDHTAQCDMAYVFGNILKLTGTIKLPQLTDRFMALNILMTNEFLQGKSKQQILEISNKFVQQKQMSFYKVKVLQEYRTTRDLTFGGKQSGSQKQILNKL